MVEDSKIMNVLFYFAISFLSLFAFIFACLTYDMLNDHRCSQLPEDEFYADKRCKYYWDEVKVREIERKYYDSVHNQG